MTESPSQSPAGPVWLWFTAWSLQGVVLLGVELLGMEGGTAKFLLSGALAGVPLIGLYWLLKRRGQASASAR